MAEKLQLLIVEDEALIAENLKFTLEDLGYTVSGIAYTFAQAQQLIATTYFDLILLDINLGSASPADTGLVLAGQVKKMARPFIFLTAYSDRATILEATHLQPNGYLIKPVNPAALFAAIQTAIEHHTQAKEIVPPFATPESPAFFFVKVGNRNLKLHWKDVYCLEASKNYVQIRVNHSPVEYTIRGTLSFVMQQLIPAALQQNFRQLNRSTCVNLHYVTAFDGEAVYCGTQRIENTRIPMRELQAQFT
ncbi:hypothetical protein GCM10028807_15140 [Spirosoma daeguense]